MGKTIKLMSPLVLIVSIIAAGACSSESFGQLYVGGDSVINNACKNCHGVNGIGGFAPPLDERIGYSFENAKQLYDKIRFEMPRNKPGSLSTLEYRQVLSYILVTNGFVNEQEIFGKLSDISIPRYPP